MEIATWIMVMLLVMIFVCLVGIFLRLKALHERVHNWLIFFPGESLNNLYKIDDVLDLLRESRERQENKTMST